MTTPVVSSITPNNCTTAGTPFAQITYYILGSNLTSLTNVSIGGNTVSFFSGDGTYIRVVTMPAHAAGVVNVTATNASGTGTGVGIFTYVAGPAVNSVSPLSGTSIGGAIVFIAGSGLTGATAVTFGGVPATIIANPNDNTIVVSAPPHAVGLVDISVTAASGTSTLTGAFTFSAPPVPAYNAYLWENCCYNWFSSDTAGTFSEGGTPSAAGGPVNTGTDPNGFGTLLDDWSDAQMAINDADYLTIVGFDFDYRGAFGIIGTSNKAGQNLSWTLIDPEESTTGDPISPAFQPNDDPNLFVDQQVAPSGATTKDGKIILFCTEFSSASITLAYPRITKDSGLTWNNVTGVPANLGWARAAFSQNGTTMYLKPDNNLGNPDHFIFKSIDVGVTWTELAGGPVYHNQQCGDSQMRLRCSADGQTVVAMAPDGNFWLSKDGGTSWTNTNFATFFGHSHGRYGDCSVTPDGSTIVVSMEQVINSGFWPGIAVSTNGGTSFTDVSANLKYPASIGPTIGGAPGNVPTGCTQCNVAPDGKGIILTFAVFQDARFTGLAGIEASVEYVNVSTNSGSTFTLRSYIAQGFDFGSLTGLFTAIYMTPYTFIPGPYPPFVTPKGGYIIERLDNRLWPTVENAWCVDCGFTLHRPTPNADLTVEPI